MEIGMRPARALRCDIHNGGTHVTFRLMLNWPSSLWSTSTRVTVVTASAALACSSASRHSVAMVMTDSAVPSEELSVKSCACDIGSEPSQVRETSRRDENQRWLAVTAVAADAREPRCATHPWDAAEEVEALAAKHRADASTAAAFG